MVKPNKALFSRPLCTAITVDSVSENWMNTFRALSAGVTISFQFCLEAKAPQITIAFYL